MTAYAEDLALALELADLADAVSLGRFRAVDLEVRTKPDRTPVTEADLAVERAIRARIAEARPDDGILGEEFGTEGDAARRWIIDPIDGTANFLRGVPVWGTLIALAVDGVPVLGVASSPAMGRRWWAVTGGGAYTTDAPGATPRRIAVSQVADLADASLSFQSLAQWRGAGYLDRLLAQKEAGEVKVVDGHVAQEPARHLHVGHRRHLGVAAGDDHLAQLANLGLLDGGKLGDAFAALVARIGAEAQSAQMVDSAQGAILTDALNAESAVSGVNVDEEASRLLQYQQAYQAAAKIIAAGKTIFDEILSLGH